MAIHFDTQGPAPDGFHVPLSSEWQGVGTIMSGLGLNTLDGWKTNLHIPLAGERRLDAAPCNQGSHGMYWSSSPYESANSDSAHNLYLNSSFVRPSDYDGRAHGFSVRCFKNSFTVPTSSWTVINGTLGGAGIFRNQTEGLISITSNGTTGYTIQDKNLGATTVYNNGDTLTQANCGKYYQWGNNYGFPRTGSVTTSSTQVDASNYGPGNYYSSSTFITRRNTTPRDRSSVQNDNLWGGTSKGIWVDYSVYDRETGQTLIYQGQCSDTDTIGDALSDVLTPNYGITNISESLGGEPLGDSVLIKNTSCIFYDVSVTPGCHLRGDYSAMQGPAPSGFHVPLSSEWVALYEILTRTFYMGANATTMGTYLKMPMAGRRKNSDASVTGIGSAGRYWSSMNVDNYAQNLDFSSSSLRLETISYPSAGYSIRCFKNSPTVPTSSWTTLYQGSGSAGVFYNATDGLISVSGDGTNWYTIMDKNLGATTVFNQGDTLTDANCGYFYQWGNNYGFPHSGTVTTSSTRVDASNYGPGNYYSSSTFITYSGAWDSTDNGNLWGGVTGVTYTEICPTYRLHGHIGTWHMESVKDYSAMQGPAPSGYHVPLSSEWQAVYNVWTALGGGSSDGPNFSIALKLPLTGGRNRGSSNVENRGSYGNYWSSTRRNDNYAYRLIFESSYIRPSFNAPRANGYSVRAFKNSPTVPTSSWTKLYGTSIEAGGIFWSSTDGLISLSSDGTTWITIQDKNLGATTVWNSGDTLSEANCGGYFQRGNNYMFPFTGSVTTSSTQVDASDYGPGNYYSSSTFITYNGRRDSTDNANLWGGVTGVVTRYVPRS